jgi:predicted ABC-type ATPase
MKTPFIIIIAGPNGVGKSTFAKWYLKDIEECSMIVDPDAIARDIRDVPESERNIAAGRLAIEIIDELLRSKASFAIETTLSGKTLASTLARARDAGYYIAVRLLWVPSVRITSERVRRRWLGGGHNIPLEDQLRRFDRCYINFFTIYRGICHDWILYLGIDEGNESIASGKGGLL